MPRTKDKNKATSVPSNLPPGLPTSGDAVWLLPDEKELIEYLVDHISEAGDNKNFKPKTFKGAADHVELIRTRGGPKTYKSCSQKYNTLRKLQALVDVIKGMSGWKWSDKNGADIDSSTAGTWDAWVANNRAATRFRNKGWPHYDIMLPLMPEKAKGSNAFRGTLSVERSSSPEWDMNLLDEEFAAGNNDGGSASSDKDASGDGASGDGAHRDEEEEDDNDDQKSDSSSPVSLSSNRKHAAALQAPRTYTRKSRLSGGAQGILDLAGAAKDMNGILGDMRDIFAIPASTSAAQGSSSTAPTTAPPALALQLSPQRRTAAIHQAQQEEWMLPQERLQLVQIVRNVETADTYLALLTEDMRIPWIIDELEKVGVTVFHHKYSLGLLSGMF
ncbi:hypothetical protein B0H13DRAFT_2384147 [Mycena leptocephala]|nr:hypothetical protein B0H13DRAFT_2384147 [Mycena leptocephala]